MSAVINSVEELREIYHQSPYYERYVIEIQTEHEGILYLKFDENKHIKYTSYEMDASRFKSRPKNYEGYKENILKAYPNSIIGFKTIKIWNNAADWYWWRE